MQLAVNGEENDPEEQPGRGQAGISQMALTDECAHEQLMSEVLHDLRSPLAAVGMLAEMLVSPAQQDLPVDTRKLELLQEAVIKAQRIVDDAAEIRNIYRGVGSLDLLTVDLAGLVRSCMEKAKHASWSKNMILEIKDQSRLLILADLEKAESVILRVLEESCLRITQPVIVQIRQSIDGEFGCLHVQTVLPNDESAIMKGGANVTSRGRLGSRRVGESRYSLGVCMRVMELMEGRLELQMPPLRLSTRLLFRLAV